MDESRQFDCWAIIEVMGHRSFAGRVCEQEIAGAGFIRVDVPAVKGAAPYTKLFSPRSIYAITPVDEAAATRFATERQERPVDIWQLPQLPEHDTEDGGW